MRKEPDMDCGNLMGQGFGHSECQLFIMGGQMNEDSDDAPAIRPKRLQPLLLDPLGVDELAAYIGELRDEIARTETAIARKQGHRAAADQFFRKP
jgi:uncharacterized small protein (DUF1192 family)